VSNTPTPEQPSQPVTRPDTGYTGQTAEAAQHADPDFRPGVRPVPEYVLVEKLGEGGFGQVWRARDDAAFEVALKFLRIDARTDATELRGVDVMRNVRHSNILPMFRTWRIGGWFVLAMELAEKTLHQRLMEVEKAGHAGIPGQELLEYLLEAAKGLDYLHGLNIQHRDIKPQNLVLVGGSVKVADFGMAKLLEYSMASNSGSLTPSFAAPEQFQGLTSPHSDQYSLAVTYCQLRTGRLPFLGSQHEVVWGHMQGEPNLGMLPEAERPVLARALAKNPDQRWRSCREFVAALAAAVPTEKRVGETAPSGMTARSRAGWRMPRYAPLGAIALLALLAVGIPYSRVQRQADRQDNEATADRGPSKDVLPKDSSAKSLPAANPKSTPKSTQGSNAAAVPKEGLEEVATRDKVADKTPAKSASGGKAAPSASSPVSKSTRPQSLDCTPETGASSEQVREFQRVWAAHLGLKSEESVEIGDGARMTFVLVPPGTFFMGSPEQEYTREADRETLHRVTLTEPFYMGKYEVTQRQYEALTHKNPSKFKGPDRPVECVSWKEATDFGSTLTATQSNGWLYRLPTEAEWEYSCRGGRPSSLAFGVGDGQSLSSRDANFDGTSPFGKASRGPNFRQTRNVGSYSANAFGLFDMHGNVEEWCQDHYGPFAAAEATNPTGPPDGPFRVIRGGGWSNDGRLCRSAARSWDGPGNRFDLLGFRLVRIPPASK
jgi:formylglycine-generating enzyme required for sulfatase activity